MADTIELLEASGRDASLRDASTEVLTLMLEQARASAALMAAVASCHEDEAPDADDGDKPHHAPAPHFG